MDKELLASDLLKVARDLISSDLNVSRVARQLGFKTEAQFRVDGDDVWILERRLDFMSMEVVVGPDGVSVNTLPLDDFSQDAIFEVENVSIANDRELKRLMAKAYRKTMSDSLFKHIKFEQGFN